MLHLQRRTKNLLKMHYVLQTMEILSQKYKDAFIRQSLKHFKTTSKHTSKVATPNAI